MKVRKRDGRLESVKTDKILSRIKRLTYELDRRYVEPLEVAKKVIEGLRDEITTGELDRLAAETAAAMTSQHPDYAVLAARIEVTRLQKEVPKSFREVIERLYRYVHPQTGLPAGLISDEVYELVQRYGTELDEAIVHDRDFNFDYFGFKTLARSYLLKLDEQTAETPQHMFLRVAVGIHGDDLPSIIKTYDLLSQNFLTHATPTLFNAGTTHPQMSSCFLLDMVDDSIKGIYETLTRCALISKSAGGIGLAVHQVRAKGSYIRSTNGYSNGLVPMLRNFNETARYVDQGGGKRKGAFAIYLEPWHADIYEVLDLRKNHGKEEMRARDLFYALWTPDLFMERVRDNGEWSLFSPDEAPGLHEVWGEEFNELYTRYEREGKARRKVKALDLWYKVLEAQLETGTPYVLFKDHANRKSNQQNLGTIKSSNLCLSGDTIVAVAAGRNGVPIEQLAAESHGEVRFPVYSARPTKAPRRGKRGGGVQENYWTTEVKWAVAFQNGTKEVVTVHLDDGSSLRCTPDHPLATRDGRWVEAQDLVEGERLAAFNSYTPLTGKSPYRFINSVTSNAQHRLIWEFHHGPRPKGFHVDHVINDGNDRLENLQLLSAEEHFVKTAAERRGAANPVHRIADREAWKVRVTNPRERNGRWSGLSDEELLVHGAQVQQRFGKLTPRTWKQYRQETGIPLPLHFSRNRFGGQWSTFKSLVEDNHRVVRVERTGEVVPVYDLTVEDNHNFYVLTSGDEGYRNSSGVLVHNCAEIIEYTDPNEIAVCNLASIVLGNYVKKEGRRAEVNYELLEQVAYQAVVNLNRVIDRNYYPVEEARHSNLRHRPVGLGVQGLANLFAELKLNFDSPEAREVNERVFETIYWGAVNASADLAEQDGPYETFANSPASRGELQFDLWELPPTSDRYDWGSLKARVQQVGLRNSLLVALMPTASTSQIMGQNESFEPFHSNLFVRRTLAGEFQVVNRYLIEELIKLGLWDEAMRQRIVAAEGSVQHITEIPQEVRHRFRTIWELPQKALVQLAADRGRYVCQSQSMNLYIREPDFKKLSSALFYGWQQGLKTGCYYLRTTASTNAGINARFEQTVAVPAVSEELPVEPKVCSLDDPSCESCGA